MRFLLLMVLTASLPGWGSETMRIALGGEVARVRLEASRLRWSEDKDDAATTGLERERVTVTLSQGRLMLDGAAMPVEALRFRAGEAGELPIQVDGVPVRGDVVVAPGVKGLVAVNVLALEDYLTGVLGSEMPRSFPVEALKAQAVAARTYALNKKLEQYGQPFHLGSSVISQVYKGLEAEDPRTREAVEATRGLVLTWQLQPIEAYFHASCGGHTETGLEALGRELPYLRSVECACRKLPVTRWSLTLPAREVAQLAGGKGGAVRVEDRSSTGRARRVMVGSRAFDGVSFRERVGYMRLKSLDFTVKKVRDGWQLDGHGFGHGAGLCQWGASAFAEQGWDFRRILAHYYPGAELQALY